MKIQDAEKLTGISCRNIRYYEKEGLLQPSRNPANQYRDYSENDIKSLQEIKLYRSLGISIADIHTLLNHKDTMQSIIEKRILSLQEEISHLQNLQKYCININSNENTDQNPIYDFEELITLSSDKVRLIFLQLKEDILTKALMGASPTAIEYFQSCNPDYNFLFEKDKIGRIPISEIEMCQNVFLLTANKLSSSI
ncbi:MAG: putative transcriptional regulator [Herbinix sp.]|jgi:DNA-binding transcriptional MerR regulator|nr:putative transcriptional regulator [Herbinix sp.]